MQTKNIKYQLAKIIFLLISKNLQMKKKRVGRHLIFMDNLIGKGSFSKVYRGIDQATEEQVAVKIITKDKIQEDEYTKHAFYTQIQILKHLKSENIIKFISINETLNNYYLITELAQSGTLRQLMKGAFSQKDSLNFMGQILNGIKQLVKFGIIHRDLKPENILVKDDTLKLADFGFAKQSDNRSFVGTIVGTPMYMSPQLLNLERYSYKCDIWALGVIFYQLVVGKLPWQPFNQKEAKLVDHIRSIQLDFPNKLAISGQVKDFIKNCLAYQQKDRYDWQSIFSHSLFINKFKISFTGEKKNSLKLAFITADLRMAIHSKNIDLGRLLDSLPPKLNGQEFESLIQIIDSRLRSNQVAQLFQQCKKMQHMNGNIIASEGLKEFFTNVGIRMKSVDLSQSQRVQKLKYQMIEEEQQRPENQNQNQNYFLLAKINNQIQQKNIDIHELYQQRDVNRTNGLELKQFAQLILFIDDSLSQNDIKLLFSQFDINKDGKITFNEYYSTLCKITGTVQNGGRIFKK